MARSSVKAVTWLSLPWLLCHFGSLESKALSHLLLRRVLVCAHRPEVTTSGAPVTLQESWPGG